MTDDNRTAFGHEQRTAWDEKLICEETMLDERTVPEANKSAYMMNANERTLVYILTLSEKPIQLLLPGYVECFSPQSQCTMRMQAALPNIFLITHIFHYYLCRQRSAAEWMFI